MPSTPEATTDGRSTIEEYNIPYNTYAYPDNFKGLLRVFGNTRTINSIRGLYDYRIIKNVHVVAASGVDGGSLVYFNVTEKPDSSVYKDWQIQSDKTSLDTKYSYKDIYDDGSIIPSPLGINPSLTIAALAFRIAEDIAGDKKYWPK